MTKWIRWWGLAAFVVIVGGTIALWTLFADGVVRRALEAAGTRMVGARVELEAADVGLSPARLELRGLAVTNPDEPMRNALKAGRLAFDIDWIGLLLDRVDIDEISVEGLRFGTERTRSGAIGRTRRTVEGTGLLTAARKRVALPPLEVPSVETVLEREQLRSPDVIAGARQTLRQRRRALEQRLGKLPGKDELERYRRRLDEIGAGDDGVSRLKAVKRLRDLIGDVHDDVEQLRAAHDEAKGSVAAAKQVADDARRAPQADIDRLYRKYTDPGAVAGELAHYLLGPKVADWINQGWYWYARLSPYLGDDDGDRGSEAVPAVRRPGRGVVYPEADAEPRWLVRRLRPSGAGGGGHLDGRVTDIAVPTSLWGEPLRLQLAGQSASGIQRLQADGTVDRRSGDAGSSRLDLEATGTGVSGLGLGPDGALRAEKGRADFRLTGGTRGRDLDLDLAVAIRGASFRVGNGVKPILREVAAALSGADRIDIAARVTGTTDAPSSG